MLGETQPFFVAMRALDPKRLAWWRVVVEPIGAPNPIRCLMEASMIRPKADLGDQRLERFSLPMGHGAFLKRPLFVCRSASLS